MGYALISRFHLSDLPIRAMNRHEVLVLSTHSLSYMQPTYKLTTQSNLFFTKTQIHIILLDFTVKFIYSFRNSHYLQHLHLQSVAYKYSSRYIPTCTY